MRACDDLITNPYECEKLEKANVEGSFFLFLLVPQLLLGWACQLWCQAKNGEGKGRGKVEEKRRGRGKVKGEGEWEIRNRAEQGDEQYVRGWSVRMIMAQGNWSPFTIDPIDNQVQESKSNEKSKKRVGGEWKKSQSEKKTNEKKKKVLWHSLEFLNIKEGLPPC